MSWPLGFRWRAAIYAMVFFVVFSIEIRVRAEEHEAHGEASHAEHHEAAAAKAEAPKPTPYPIPDQELSRAAEAKTVATIEMQPEKCVESDPEKACALRTDDDPAEFDFAGGRLTMDQKTALIRVSDHEVRLLSGQIWIRSKAEAVVGAEYGSITMEAGEYWLRRDHGRLTASVVDGAAILAPRGSGDRLEVAAGEENWLGGVDASGRARSGSPVAILFEAHLKRWARLFKGPKAEFEARATAFHERWVAAAQKAAEVHRELFDLKQASLREEQKRKDEARRKVEAHNRELIELFRRKVFEE